MNTTSNWNKNGRHKINNFPFFTLAHSKHNNPLHGNLIPDGINVLLALGQRRESELELINIPPPACDNKSSFAMIINQIILLRRRRRSGYAINFDFN